MGSVHTIATSKSQNGCEIHNFDRWSFDEYPLFLFSDIMMRST